MSNVNLASAVTEILEDYSDQVQATLNEVTKDVAKEAVKKLKSISPKGTGDYAKGWKAKTTGSRLGIQNVIYNANKPGLTHLLENGHAKRGGGRTPAHEHIKPVEEWANEEVVRKVKEDLK